MNNVFVWAKDYIQMTKGHVVSYLYRNPPDSYTNHTVAVKVPVVLIPGFFERWGFLKYIADNLSNDGHPIYIVSELGSNLSMIAESAEMVRKLIEKENLRNVILIGHSKGGLIGKYLLCFLNDNNRIAKLIAIATPFSGSSFASYVPHRAFRDVQIHSSLVQRLQECTFVNNKIISIAPKFDNHIRSPKGSYLEGAINVTLPVQGHHAIVFDPKLIDVIKNYL